MPFDLVTRQPIPSVKIRTLYPIPVPIPYYPIPSYPIPYFINNINDVTPDNDIINDIL